jgi:hypothetical protein
VAAGGHAGRVSAGIHQANHERLCASPHKYLLTITGASVFSLSTEFLGKTLPYFIIDNLNQK